MLFDFFYVLYKFFDIENDGLKRVVEIIFLL